jgi:hypothetical protein
MQHKPLGQTGLTTSEEKGRRKRRRKRGRIYLVPDRTPPNQAKADQHSTGIDPYGLAAIGRP